MIKNSLNIILNVLLLSIFFHIGLSSVFSKTKANNIVTTKSKIRKTTYKPPLRGMPDNRIFGGSRGNNSNETFLTVIAPNHTGYTINGSPKLYWFSASTIEKPLEFSLINPDIPNPMIEIIVDKEVKKGIHSINLSHYNIRLQPNIEYQWSVSIIFDPADRSRDIVSTSPLLRIDNIISAPVPSGEKQNLKSIKDFADRGIWHDMFDQLYTLSKSTSSSDDISQLLQDTLMNIDLAPVAKFLKSSVK